MHRFTSKLGLLLLPALLVLSACDSHDHDDHAGIDRVLIETRGTQAGQVIGEWTRTGGWQQSALPTLTVGDESNNFGRSSWTVRIFEGGQELNLARPQSGGPCGEYSARYSVQGNDVIYNPGETGRVMVGGVEREAFHCDHIHVYPRAAGSTTMDIVLWHVDHADGRTTQIPISVQTAAQ